MTKAQELHGHKKSVAFHKRCMEAHAAEPGALNKTLASAHEEQMIHHEACCKVLESDSNDVDDVDVTNEGNRGKGGDLDGPSKKSADAPFGMVAALRKSPSFGMAAAQRDLDKIAPTEVHGVVSSQREFIPRVGGPSSPSAVDPTSAIDSLKK